MPRTYRTIDSDGHVTEPPDLWQNYIDPAFRDRAPRFVSNADGSECNTDGFPGAPDMIRSLGLPAETQRRVFAEGAIRFYGMGDPAELLAPAEVCETA
jgi:hypothetical protein